MLSFSGAPFLASFAAGLLTFVSPCILPLIPAYITYIAGVSLDELRAGGTSSRRIAFKAFFFVLGFSVVFVALGASATWLGGLVAGHKLLFRWIGGLVIIVFGLHVAGIWRIGFLYQEKRMTLAPGPMGFLGPFIVGVAFAAGWTPCVGPILSSILILASTQGSVSKGVLLLAVYSLGLAIPFMLTALFIGRAIRIFERIRSVYHYIEVGAGLVLVVVGVLVITDGFTLITRFFLSMGQ